MTRQLVLTGFHFFQTRDERHPESDLTEVVVACPNLDWQHSSLRARSLQFDAMVNPCSSQASVPPVMLLTFW